MTTIEASRINETKLHEVVGRAVDDLGALASSALVLLGRDLGLYEALEASGPATPRELAEACSADENYIRPWLTNQAAAGFVDYSPETGRFSLSPEQALVFASPDSPVAMLGNFETFYGALKARPRIGRAIRNGGGMAWGDHDEGMIAGVAEGFRVGYLHQLVQNWLPALSGVVENLERGAFVADVGCGYGTSTMIMARAFPNSRFVGIDNHAPSIERATRDAAAAGLTNVGFEVGTAQEYEGNMFELVAFFDALHDMGDPAGAVRHAREALKPGGTVMIVEPLAGDRLEENFTPVGRMYSAASVLLCTPHAISEGSPRPLGTIATEQELASLFEEAGFPTFRRVAETVTNRVFEAR